ncbi:MAG: hypothetical protein GXP45_00005 [bacterium]|nr:hypothetical protein [bacterium]
MGKKKKKALKELKKRKKSQPKQIENDRLPAGFPMYFYCKICGHVSDILPENYLSTPKKLCDKCKHIKDMGWLD